MSKKTNLENVSKDDIKRILAGRNISVNAGSCGCCQSPWVQIRAGDRIYKDEGANFIMEPNEFTAAWQDDNDNDSDEE